MIYYVDTDILNEFFKFPIHTKSLFVWLDEYSQKGNLRSVEMVKYEIMKRRPSEEARRLKLWVKNNSGIFLKFEDEIRENYTEIVDWINKKWGNSTESKRFKNGADPILIAAAKHSDCIVVTNEKYARRDREIKIPDICDEFGVQHTNFHGMFEKEGYHFQLVKSDR